MKSTIEVEESEKKAKRKENALRNLGIEPRAPRRCGWQRRILPLNQLRGFLVDDEVSWIVIRRISAAIQRRD